jgi:hypothetical protein
MRFALAVLLAAHGVAHLPGFLASWKLANLPELPYKTTLFAGAIDVGAAGVRLAGALWLMAALAFLIAAAGVVAEARWGMRLAVFAVIGSMALCAAGWPDARIGFAVNVVFAVALTFGARLRLADLVF